MPSHDAACEHGYGPKDCTHPSCPNAAPEKPLAACGCRSSATCAECLAEADLTLEHVPMGEQARTPLVCNCGVEQDGDIHDFGCPLYPEHAPRWP